VSLGDRLGIEVGADHAARRRGLLHFGDDRPSRPGERGGERSARLLVERRLRERRERTLPLVLRDLFPLGGDDVVEDHAGPPARLAPTTRSRSARARPPSIAALAAVIPSSIDAARSAA